MPLETVTTVVVQDREYGQDGKPLVNQEVTVRLAPAALYFIAAGAAGNADQVALQPTEIRTKTDPTGFWSVSLVQNSVITPANTFYSVKVGLIKTYDINVPTGAGPFIASNILTGPLPIFPGGSSVAGPITINGNLTVTGTGTFSGALAANAGLTVLGGGNIAGGGTVTGGLTVGGLLTMTDAASRLVPGATSFSIRDTANANDNLLVSNAGNVTVRGNLTVTGGPLTVSAGGASITGGATIATGDLSVTAGRLVFGAATARVIPGASAISLRNNADSADNVLVADAGLVTLRNALSIPPLAAGTVAPTSYGTVPVKIAETTLGASAASITFSSLPSGFRHFQIIGMYQGTVAPVNLLLQFNGDTATNYDWNQIESNSAGTITGTFQAAATAIKLYTSNSVAAGIFTAVQVLIYNVQQALNKMVTASSSRSDGNGLPFQATNAGMWRNTAALTSITLLANLNALAAGSTFSLYGIP